MYDRENGKIVVFVTLVKFVVGWVVKILNLVRYFFHLTVSKLELSGFGGRSPNRKLKMHITADRKTSNRSPKMEKMNLSNRHQTTFLGVT